MTFKYFIYFEQILYKLLKKKTVQNNQSINVSYFYTKKNTGYKQLFRQSSPSKLCQPVSGKPGFHIPETIIKALI